MPWNDLEVAWLCRAREGIIPFGRDQTTLDMEERIIDTSEVNAGEF
jgi:hypothetical protein